MTDRQGSGIVEEEEVTVASVKNVFSLKNASECVFVCHDDRPSDATKNAFFCDQMRVYCDHGKNAFLNHATQSNHLAKYILANLFIFKGILYFFQDIYFRSYTTVFTDNGEPSCNY